jgi:hypothetical protein
MHQQGCGVVLTVNWVCKKIYNWTCELVVTILAAHFWTHGYICISCTLHI